MLTLISGGLENDIRFGFRGWALDASQLKSHLMVTVEVDGLPVAKVKARRSRASLRTRFGGDGRHGFRILAPVSYYDGTERHVRILVGSDNEPIHSGPLRFGDLRIGRSISVENGLAQPQLFGAVPLIADSYVRGWAINSAKLDEQLKVDLVLDSEVAATAWANCTIRALENGPDHINEHAFKIPFPPGILDGRRHRVEVRLHGSDLVLFATTASVVTRPGDLSPTDDHIRNEDHGHEETPVTIAPSRQGDIVKVYDHASDVIIKSSQESKGSKRPGKDVVVPANGNDIRRLGRIFLGSPTDPGLHGTGPMSLARLIADLLVSDELYTRVVEPLLADQELPHEKLGIELMLSDAAWARNNLPLSEATRFETLPGADWRQLLSRILSDQEMLACAAATHAGTGRFQRLNDSVATVKSKRSGRRAPPAKPDISAAGATVGEENTPATTPSGGAKHHHPSSAASQPTREKAWKMTGEYMREGNRLQRLLHLGYSEMAERQLFLLAYNGTMSPQTRVYAAYVLSVWLSLRETAASSSEVIGLLKYCASEPGIGNWREQERKLLLAEALGRVGHSAQARRLLIGTSGSVAERQQRAYALANLFDPPLRGDLGLAALNEAYAHDGLAKVRRIDGTRELQLSNIAAAGAEARGVGGAKVTVILPAYNCAETLLTALDSISRQTWDNLEIILSDDASTDGTLDLALQYAQHEPRLKVLSAAENRGPYWARNAALDEATGEFVTTHDTDDWSHPQKVALQVQHLLSNPSVVGNYTQMIRINPQSEFLRRGRLAYSGPCLSSFLFRRTKVMERLGYWDSVRFAGDSEMLKRCSKVFGPDAILELKGAPLTIMHQGDGNITSSLVSQYSGFKFGARKEYEEAATDWYERGSSLYISRDTPSRPFPLPLIMSPKYRAPISGGNRLDILLASDFRLLGGTNQSNLQEINVHRQMGLKTGLLQLSRTDLQSHRPISAKVRDQVDGDGVRMITFGEDVECDLLIVRHPPVLNHLGINPNIRARSAIVVINEPPYRVKNDEVFEMYDPEACSRNLVKLVNCQTDPVWAPIGPVARESFIRAYPKFPIADFNWLNILDESEWPPRVESLRSRVIRKPVVGRHSRDQYTKWPDGAPELTAAYLSPTFDTKILGGADAAYSVLGYEPESWEVLPFDSVSPADFLRTLDFFVYFTHPEWEEAFGRSILEAILVGVPVITHKKLRPLFEDSVIYAEPWEVAEIVSGLWSNPDGYEARVGKARDFALKNFGPDLHVRRISELLRTSLPHVVHQQ